VTIVFDLDNTLTDEMGATVRPGMRALLERLRTEGHVLVLWTNSTRDRARSILREHDIDRYFRRCVFREDYDPSDKGTRKDVRSVRGDVLVDDSPEEVAFATSVGVRAFRIASYRKGGQPPAGELDELYRFVTRPKGLLGKLFR
jgi:FMN phosphatase YigB (HAD superfamily)